MLKSDIEIPPYTLEKYVKNSGNHKVIFGVTGIMEGAAIGAAGVGAGAEMGELVLPGTAGIAVGIAAGVGASLAFFGKLGGVTGRSFIHYKYSEELIEKALEESELMRLLNENGTTKITQKIIDGLEKYIIYTTDKPNVIGINDSEIGLKNKSNGFQYIKKVSDLPNSPLEKHIKKNFHFYQN
jgi:hypothetical protein